MNFLIVGSGGREHALCRVLNYSKNVESVFCAPGGDGFSPFADRIEMDINNHSAVIEMCRLKKIDCVVIGPEKELVAGLSDSLRSNGIMVVGPDQRAAQLEGSKVFAKKWMKNFGIPTANADVVTSSRQTLELAENYSPPYVLKADGLAAGKGVYICKNKDELAQAARQLFDKKIFGSAGERALLEEFLPGKELSVLALTNGTDFQIMPFCRDHKRLLDGDKGPNTGGMGVVGPVEIDSELLESIKKQIVAPTIKGLKESEFLYRGVIFIGVMLTANGPSVLEYNVRFGDPEAQVILSLLDGDWAEVFSSLAKGELLEMKWLREYRTCIVLAAEGYPESPVKGVRVEGDLSEFKNSHILHAGTRKTNSHFETNGGRVLNVIGYGKTAEESRKSAYDRVAEISWPGMQFRKDIGSTI